MGYNSSKHIKFQETSDFFSSKEFRLKRKIHYKSEFTLAKKTLIENDENLLLSKRSDEDGISIQSEQQIFDSSSSQASRNANGLVHNKHTTFLEPPHLEDKSKDVFRRKSLRSEINEFTFAKEKQETKRKKKRSRLDKSHEIEPKKHHKNKKDSTIRNRSHEPIEKQHYN